MVLIVKKFVKVFPEYEDVPRRYKNLRKNKHVKTFSRPFANIPEILVKKYKLAGIIRRRKPAPSRGVPSETLEELVKESDFVITGVGD